MSVVLDDGLVVFVGEVGVVGDVDIYDLVVVVDVDCDVVWVRFEGVEVFYLVVGLYERVEAWCFG